MEWDSKISSWDFELAQHAEPNIGSVVGLSGGLGSQSGGVECSVDLKLGGLGEFRPSERWKEQPRVSTLASSSSGSSKRARAPSSAMQNVSCLVDGCKADLSNCRDYHRRHKVCEVHSKTPIVMVGGQEQRFCQQCSRFHLLAEFDEVKRSCRKRLDGHNRRRRKPQPESIISGGMFPNHHGTGLSTYPQIFPTATPETTWAGIAKSEEDALYAHHPSLHFMDRQHHVGSFSCSFREGKQFPFLQDSDSAFGSRATLKPSVCQPLLRTNSLAESCGGKFFSDGLNQVLESECALSLLSSPTQTSDINVGQMVSADRIPMGQPLVSTIQYGGLGRYSGSQASSSVSPVGFSCSGIEDEHHVGSVLVSDAGDAELHCQSIFHVGGEGLSTSQSLPFSWQ